MPLVIGIFDIYPLKPAFAVPAKGLSFMLMPTTTGQVTSGYKFPASILCPAIQGWSDAEAYDCR